MQPATFACNTYTDRLMLYKELEVREINRPGPTQQEKMSHPGHKVGCDMCREAGGTDERLWEFREGS